MNTSTDLAKYVQQTLEDIRKGVDEAGKSGAPVDYPKLVNFNLYDTGDSIHFQVPFTVSRPVDKK